MTVRSIRLDRPRTSGITLVELMIAMVVGMFIVLAMSTLFVGSSTSRREMQASAEAAENGRYALDLLTKELSMAGFYSSLAAGAPGFTSLPGSIDPCSDAVASWAGQLLVHAVGYNNNAGGPSCVTRKTGTDAIFIQRAATCAVGETSCGAEVNTEGYLQVSECGTEYSTSAFVVAQGATAANFPLLTKSCTSGTIAPKRRLIRRFFYIDANDVLNYVDFGLTGTASTPVALVENIEQMQIEYALDTNGDGTAETFTSTPSNMTQWSQTIGVRLYLLARSTDTSRNTNNQSTFTLGDTTVSISASTAAFKRRVYQTYIPFLSPKARRES